MTRAVHKVGTSVRLDTTIVDFEDLRWKRGDLSFLFALDDTGRGTCVVLDNDMKKFAYLTRDDFSTVLKSLGACSLNLIPLKLICSEIS